MFKKTLLLFLYFSLFFSIPCCKKEAPTSPDIPDIITPTVNTITVFSSSVLMHIDTIEIFTATATMSDGSSKAVVGGVWSLDDWAVATVDASTGEVTIIGSGTVNIFVDYEGRRGTKAIRGLPNYQGYWSGSYIITTCDATGDFLFSQFCSTFSVGMVLPVELVLTQIQDQVTGLFYLGYLSADAIGPIQTDGQLLLAGVVTSDPFTINVGMQLQSTTPGQITGGMGQIYTATGYSGNGRLSCDIINLNLASTTMMALPPKEWLMTLTLQDLLRALLRR